MVESLGSDVPQATHPIFHKARIGYSPFVGFHASNMGGSQNWGPILVPLKIRCRHVS